jgi:arylsulfatase A-like enzyme
MNVILVILDSLRKDHVGAYGDDRIKTPNLDAVAAEGLRFTRAHPDAMPTIPARRAIHTGMRTLPFKVRWAPIPEEQTTLAEILKKEGYHTALVTDTYHQFKMNFGRGFDAYRKIRGQERDHYKDPSVISEEWMRERYLILGEGKKARQYLANVQGRKSEEDWFAPKVFLGAMDLLEEARRKEPFFLVADCFDPHEPWDPPKEYVDLYDEGYEGKEPLNDNYGKDDYLTDRQLLRMRALYAGEITMADRWLGHFLGKANNLGVMENTLLVVIRSHLINGKVVPSCFYSTEVRRGPYRRAVGSVGAPDPRPPVTRTSDGSVNLVPASSLLAQAEDEEPHHQSSQHPQQLNLIQPQQLRQTHLLSPAPPSQVAPLPLHESSGQHLDKIV